MNKNVSLVIDFDDTLVESNTARDILKEYVPEEYEKISKLYHSKIINFREYQEKSFEKAFETTSISNIEKSSVKQSTIRKGFESLVEYCYKSNIEIFVLSSGLKIYIKPVLNKFLDKIKIVAAETFVNSNGKVDFSYNDSFSKECSNQWGICKCQKVNSLKQSSYVIYVGDGITTDLGASVNCNEIFALNPLYNKLLEKKISVNKFKDFDQLKEHLIKIKGKTIDS